MAFIASMSHNFSGDFPTPATTLPMWYDDNTCYGITEITTPFSRSPSLKASNSFPERFGVSEMLVPTSPPRLCSIPAGTDYQNMVEILQDDLYFGSSGGYGTNSWSSSYPTSTTNWEIEGQQKRMNKEIEEPTSLKIGKYSMEERKDKITRYLKKRNQRNFNKTIKYECRKTLADKRIRVRGRFAKNNNSHQHHDHQCCEDQVLPNINTAMINPCEEDIQQLYNNTFLMKHDYDEDQEWLQEAMASLLYSP